MKYQSLRGTHDILPDQTPVWQYVETKIHDKFQSCGFCEIRTPAIEQAELFTRSIGDNTDIVSKEMYTFEDKGGRSISLRPEATASVVRAAIEHNLAIKDKISKLYYIGPMFRYERPQAGRFRQFYQAGVELLGSSSAFADAEVILAGVLLFNSLGLRSLEVEINSVGCGKCRPAYEKELKKHLEEHSSKLCFECRERTDKNVLRTLDCKKAACREIISSAPSLKGMLCEDCRAHFDQLQSALSSFGVKVSVNEKLVRGLDYYTKTTFEILSKELGAQNAVCGGGRYDALIEQLGGSKIPAVGMAIGLERLISVMEAQKLFPEPEKELAVYIAAMGKEAQQKAFKQVFELRKSGVSAETDLSGKSLKSQLKAADNLGAKYVLIIGEEELKKGLFPLRNMKTGQQKEIKMDELFREIEPTC
ncbi:MAG: histidine--tRNA ligase [Candidatus Margulisiibacteriota bacterium]